MAVRAIARRATVLGIPAHPSTAPIYVDLDDNIVKIVPAGTGSTEVQIIDASSAQTLTNKTLTTPTIASSSSIPYVQDATGAGSIKVARGTGTFVTGTVVIATGLDTVDAFVATLEGTGAGTSGASEIERVNVSSITTGAVSCVGSYHSATAGTSVISASGTSTFRWIAFGT